eukprot:125974-Lingulodinium_polyedra.AAC.1
MPRLSESRVHIAWRQPCRCRRRRGHQGLGGRGGIFGRVGAWSGQAASGGVDEAGRWGVRATS